MPTPSRPHLSGSRIIGIATGLTTLLSLLLIAFAWPISELGAREVPLVVAGPETAVARVTERLPAQDGDAFAMDTVADRQAAVAAVTDRDAYGGIVVGPEGTEVLTATGGSPAVAQTLAGLAERMDGATVTDLVPPTEDDPRGQVFAAAALPLVLGGLAVGAISALLPLTSRSRVTLVAGTAVAAGAALAGILQGWLGALHGSYGANAVVISLAIAATGYTVVGLHAALGRAGLALAALTLMLIGNPLSGLTSAPELLPFGWLGQLLPPGAAGTALRSTSFFDGAGASVPVMVLAAWALAGLLLTLLAGRRTGGGASQEPADDAGVRASA